MTRLISAVALCFVVLFGLAGCGSSSTTDSSTNGTTSSTVSVSDCPTSSTTSFAKTKFVLHVGLAAGTFHRYIYKPFKAGTFTKGAHGRTLALIKAAATTAFGAHELKKATEDVKADPTLCKALIVPIGRLSDALGGLKSKIASGDLSSIAGIAGSVSSLEALASKAGLPITESTDQSKG